MRWLQALGVLVFYVWLAFGTFMIGFTVTHWPKAEGKTRGHTMTAQRISATGLAHIKHFEGCSLKSYYCVAGRCTIGYGSTGPHVKPGMVITHERAEELLRQDVAKAEKAVTELVKVPLTQGQFDAAVDFVFNLGRDALAKSSLLKLLNQGRHDDAGEQLMRWVHAGSRVIPGLQRRRQAARDLWFDRA